MRLSVVVTVRNEESSLDELLAALATQSRPADEIVIADGGSTDRSREILRRAAEDSSLRLIEAPGTNISQGRNRAIAASSGDFVAITDAGCRPDADWLASLERRLRGDASLERRLRTEVNLELLAGRVESTVSTPLERAIGQCSLAFKGEYGGVYFLPTARNLTLSRELWQRLGGFPENLILGEDAELVERAVEAGARVGYEPAARVLWTPRQSLGALFRQFHGYARWLVRAGRGRRYHLRTLTLDAALLAGLAAAASGWFWPALAAGSAVFGLYFARKARQGCFDGLPPALKWLPVPILATIHLGTLAGIFHGWWERCRGLGES